MRQIKCFSARLGYASSRTSFSGGRPLREKSDEHKDIKVFMTPSLVRMSVNEMRKSVNIRFLQLIKSCRQFSKRCKVEEIPLLKKFMVAQLTELLGSYVDMLQSSASLQLHNYLKLSTVAPEAMKEAKVLSKAMIAANRVRRANGVLPAKNQRDLNRAMNDFMEAIINICIDKGVNVNNPILNDNLSDEI